MSNAVCGKYDMENQRVISKNLISAWFDVCGSIVKILYPNLSARNQVPHDNDDFPVSVEQGMAWQRGTSDVETT